MATWDMLGFEVNRVANTVSFYRYFYGDKVYKMELTKKIIKQISRILHDKNRGYDVTYTQSTMQGFPYFSNIYQNDCSPYKTK